MATEATLKHVDIDLWSLEAEIDDLPELAEDWNSLSENNNVSYLLEWHNEMGKLKFLARAHQSGDMTPTQQVRYKALLAKLKEYQPIIERLELSVPKL